MGVSARSCPVLLTSFHMWLFLSLFALYALHTTCYASQQGTVVYPMFLEGRSSSGARMLKVKDDLVLHMEQKSAYDDMLLIRETREDNIMVQSYVPTSEFNSKLFEDRQQMASVVITDDDGLRVCGIIGDDLRVRPLSTMERTAEGHVPHLLYREEDLPNGPPVTDYVSIPSSKASRLRHDQVIVEERTSSIKIIKPEIHVVIDAVYYKAFQSSQGDIIAYFGALVNSVNLRYKTIKDPKVLIKITGFTFNKDEEDTFIATFWRDGSNHPDLVPTLQNFRDAYEKNQSHLFANVDIFVLVTGRDMCRLEGTSLACDVAGLAYIGGACTQYHTALAEDAPWLFRGAHIIAHEVAHSLGCGHDGDGPEQSIPGHPGAESCPWSSGYIMSYVRDSTKQYQFSPCCEEQIQYVASLPSRACLHQNNTKRQVAITDDLPGSLTSRNELCRLTFAFSGRQFYFDEAVPIEGCTVPCRSPLFEGPNGQQYSSGVANALDGTRCTGENMVCIRGECVSKSKGKKKKKPAKTNSKREAPVARKPKISPWRTAYYAKFV